MCPTNRSVCRASSRTWWKIAIHVPACNSTRAKRARDANRESCVRRNAQSHARTHFSRGRESRSGFRCRGICARHPIHRAPSCPTTREVTRRMVFAVQRSGNELSTAVEVIEKILESPPAPRHRVASIRFRRDNLSDDLWLTWHTSKIRRERATTIRRIESVRMEQSNRSREEEAILSRSMGGRQWQDYIRRKEHEVFVL